MDWVGKTAVHYDPTLYELPRIIWKWEGPNGDHVRLVQVEDDLVVPEQLIDGVWSPIEWQHRWTNDLALQYAAGLTQVALSSRNPVNFKEVYVRRSRMREYEELKDLVEECAADMEKFENGNKSAGTRVRKAMQDIKAKAQEIRKVVIAKRDEK